MIDADRADPQQAEAEQHRPDACPMKKKNACSDVAAQRAVFDNSVACTWIEPCRRKNAKPSTVNAASWIGHAN